MESVATGRRTGIDVRKLVNDTREYAAGRITYRELLERHDANQGDAADRLALSPTGRRAENAIIAAATFSEGV